MENYIYANVLTGNGTDPDDGVGFGADAVALFLSGPAGNCQSDNVFTTQVSFTASLPVCTLPPPAFASCPAPPVP